MALRVGEGAWFRFKQLLVEVHRRSLWPVLLVYVGGSLAAYQAVQSLTVQASN